MAIEQLVEKGSEKYLADPAKLGRAKRLDDANGRYIEHVKSTFPKGLRLSGLKIVVDCANGAAYHVAPNVFSELGAEVIAVANDPDGFNINHECGSTHLELLKKTVSETGADVGVALDGDGDRCLLIDAQGEAVDGDQLLYILGTSRHVENRLHGGIVGTLMSNMGLEQACRDRGVPFMRAKVGDRYVLQLLQQQGWILGGESSGHIICLDKSTTGDGIIAALEVLTTMVEQGSTLADLKAGMVVFPQRMINVRTERRFDPESSELARGALRVARWLAAAPPGLHDVALALGLQGPRPAG